jgi:hypothetical protein
MSTSKATKTNHRTIVSLKLPSPVPALITYVQGIVTAMTGNPSFPTPTPPLAVLSTAIGTLQTCETAALARTKGAVIKRNEARTALVVLVQQLRGYIQAGADADVENGASIIASAGVAVRKTPVHPARVFTVKPGAVSGSAKIVAASAGHRASYEWEYSTDGGKTWVIAPATLQAKTIVYGLVPGSTAQFRYRHVRKRPGPPCEKHGPGRLSCAQIFSFDQTSR